MRSPSHLLHTIHSFRDLNSGSVGAFCSLRLFYLVVIGCYGCCFDDHQYSPFLVSSYCGSSYYSPEILVTGAYKPWQTCYLSALCGVLLFIPTHFCRVEPIPLILHRQVRNDQSGMRQLSRSSTFLLFSGSNLLTENLPCSDLLVAMGFFPMVLSPNFAGMIEAVTFFLYSSPALFWYLRCDGYCHTSVVWRSLFPCVPSIVPVRPVVILLSASSLLNRRIGTKPTNVGKSCESGG